MGSNATCEVEKTYFIKQKVLTCKNESVKPSVARAHLLFETLI